MPNRFSRHCLENLCELKETKRKKRRKWKENMTQNKTCKCFTSHPLAVDLTWRRIWMQQNTYHTHFTLCVLCMCVFITPWGKWCVYPRFHFIWSSIEMQASVSINLCDFKSFNHGHFCNATFKMHLRFSIYSKNGTMCILQDEEEINHQNQALKMGEK